MVDASLSDIASNTRKLSQAWYAHHDTWLTESVRGKLKLISELLCIKHHYLKLDLFKADEVNIVIDFLCTNYDDVVISHCFFIFIFTSVFTVYYCTNFVLNK